MFGDGTSKYIDYLVDNNENPVDYIKIATGEIGGIFLSLESGEVWAQHINENSIVQNKLATDFESFLLGYTFLQKNRMENKLPIREAAKIVSEKIGSDNDEVWLHSIS